MYELQIKDVMRAVGLAMIAASIPLLAFGQGSGYTCASQVYNGCDPGAYECCSWTTY
ncbi:hypothetical protein RAS1_23640 [Phycisphaerae bacterium RAS1]|nr:hypothetical protein RAS1_23640 [Phycisphaerae bacterium RAS1]